MRCINAGMKVDAVQNERDIIGRRNRPQPSTSSESLGIPSDCMTPDKPGRTRRSFSRSSPLSCTSSQHLPCSSSWDAPRALLESLLVSEKKIQSLRDTVIKQVGAAGSSGIEEQVLPNFTDHGRRTATVSDIYLSIHSQLLLVIEWAKTLPPFSALSTDDQTALLKSFASQHVILCVSYRSKDNSGFLKLLNDSCIPRCHRTDGELLENIYLRDCERIMDQLVAPMRYLKMDDVEFVALKACVLFNPVAKGLSSGSVMQVLATRRQIFAALEHYISTKIPADPNRIGDLTFFVLSPLQALANAVSEDVLVYKLSGVAHIDQLMEELILVETEEHKVPNRINNDLSFESICMGVLKSPRLHSPIVNKQRSGIINQSSSTPGASPDEIISGFDEPQSVSSFDNNYSPSTAVLSSMTIDQPFRSESQSSNETLLRMTSDSLPLTVTSLGSRLSNYPNCTWTTITQSNAYLDNEVTFAASTINL